MYVYECVINQIKALNIWNSYFSLVFKCQTNQSPLKRLVMKVSLWTCAWANFLSLILKVLFHVWNIKRSLFCGQFQRGVEITLLFENRIYPWLYCTFIPSRVNKYTETKCRGADSGVLPQLLTNVCSLLAHKAPIIVNVLSFKVSINL